MCVYEVTPQSIYNHENNLVEMTDWGLSKREIFVFGQTWHKRFIREEASGKDQDGYGYEDVGEEEETLARVPAGIVSRHDDGVRVAEDILANTS